MLDWEGNIVNMKDRAQFPCFDIEISDLTLISSCIPAAESNMIDQIITDDDLEMSIPTETSYPEVPGDVNGITGVLIEISSTLDDKTLCNLLHSRADLGRYQSAIS
eukprot:3241170-Ditylum_brightwellii.AAC.1